jgi:hypothetical protein
MEQFNSSEKRIPEPEKRIILLNFMRVKMFFYICTQCYKNKHPNNTDFKYLPFLTQSHAKEF